MANCAPFTKFAKKISCKIFPTYSILCSMLYFIIVIIYRSCIKKILERDDNPTKTMVLVITEICSFDDNAIDNEDDIKVLSYIINI